MLEQIVMKNVATYSESGVEINDLKKVNFIYGTNGCGKTTISNFLKNPSDEKYSQCSQKWQNDFRLKTYVYNKQFREENFGSGKIPGVFTIGRATTDQIGIINKKKETQNEIIAEENKNRFRLNEIKKNINQLEDEYQNLLWDKVYKKYEKDFASFLGKKNKKIFASKLIDTCEKKSFQNVIFLK